jgi:hypothetical protein
MQRIDRNSQERETVSSHEYEHRILISTATTRWILILERERETGTRAMHISKCHAFGEPYGAII